MKKSKLLILFPIMGLFLSGCTFQEGLQSTKSWIKSHIYQPLKSFFGSSSTPSEEGKKDEGGKEQPKDEGKTFSFADWVTKYKEYGFADVVIPDYKAASSEASMAQPDATTYPNLYVVKGSSETEMKAYLDSLESAGWDVEEDTSSYGGFNAYFGDRTEDCPYMWVVDHSSGDYEDAYKGISIQFLVYEAPVASTEFPLEYVNSFFTDDWQGYYGFTISQAEADAISALSSSFVAGKGEDSQGYPTCTVMMQGEVAAQVEAILLDTITTAGFTYDAEYEGYYNEDNFCVAFEASEGYTYIYFC